jgi:diguanylate cyclase (GGDEF)-like protein/PAS domain S-box-containing protein
MRRILDRLMNYRRAHKERSGRQLPATARATAFLRAVREIYLFGGLLVLVVVSLLIVASVGMDTLSATRAYATGEGLWSKRQKEAVNALVRYASSRDERDYEAYRSALEVPLGDKQARLELQKEAPDLAVARAGFLKGKNHPDDIPKLIQLFRRFRSFELMATAIRIWTEGDGQIERLMALGHELKSEVAGPARADEVRRLLGEIAAVDREVTPLEDAFSQQLGQAARWAQGAVLLLLVSVGGIVLVVCVPLSVRVLREARASQRTIRGSERRFRALIENSSDAIALFGPDGTILYASAATTRVLGYTLEEFVGHNAFEFIHPEARSEVAACLKDALDSPGTTVRVSANVRHRNGDWRFLEGILTNLLNDPAVGAIVNNYRDITERKRSEDALRASEVRYRSLFERNLAGVFRTSLDGTFLDCNEAFALVLGYESREELLRRPVEEFYETSSEHQAFLARLKKEKVLANLEARYRRRDGSTVWTLENVSLVEDGGASVIEGTLIDISERKTAQQQVEYQAYHDALTGLPNRLLLRDRLTVALAHARRQSRTLVVMFLDLDRFKLVNDSLGHSLGDSLLKGVAERLVQSVREEDTVARVGGDEFVMLFPGITRNEDSASMARKILDAVAQPLRLEGHEVYPTTSIGIAVYPTDGGDADALLKSADSAMYRAKERGRNAYQHWTPGMNARAIERVAVEGRLRRALERNEFLLHYQPIVETLGARVMRVEALVRWQDPKGVCSTRARSFPWPRNAASSSLSESGSCAPPSASSRLGIAPG